MKPAGQKGKRKNPHEFDCILKMANMRTVRLDLTELPRAA